MYWYISDDKYSEGGFCNFGFNIIPNFLLYFEVDFDFPTDEVDLFLECELGNGLIF